MPIQFWETFHSHAFPWTSVAAGYWSRYPNQHSSHVFSVDTLETRIVDGKLYCRRLIIKTNPLPSWGRHFFKARRVPVIEECIVDPNSQKLTWYVRNIGLNAFMATVEKATLYPAETEGTTTVNKQCWIDSSIIGFRSAIRKFGIDRYKKNSPLATEGFETVLERLNKSATASADSSPNPSKPSEAAPKAAQSVRPLSSTVPLSELNSRYTHAKIV